MPTLTRTHLLRRPLPAALLLFVLLLLAGPAAWAQPTVTGFSPASGSAGSNVTVTGTNFTNVTSVRFGELSATFVVNNTGQLTAVVPRAASTQPIIVTTTAGSEISPTAFAVTRNASLTYTLAANNFGGINVGTNAAPAVGDLNGNGLLDLLVGRADGTIARYEQSSPNATTFNSLGLLTAGGVTIDRGTEATVAIVDTDSDGKFNVLLGGADGYVYDYEQTAVGSATFVEISDFVGQISTTSDSAPSVTNLDGDGRLELVTGKGDGIVSFAEQNSRNDPAFAVYDTNYQTVTASSAPFCVDLDGNGRVDVLIGVAGGNIYRYEQSAANNRTLTQRTSVFNSIDVGTNAKPCVTDIDGDGLLDLLIGRGDGTIDRYEQTPPPNTAPTDISLSNASVAENQSLNTAVGTLSTTDANAGDTFTYTFFSGGPDNGSFNIIGNTTLTTNRVFDFETKSSYTVRIRSTDQDGLSFIKDLTITVTDVNETPTVTSFTPTSGTVGTSGIVITGSNFQSAGAVTVKFNGTTATTVTVSSNTQLTATVPTGATTGRITVQNADGTGTSPTDFTVTLPVVLATVTTAAPASIAATSAVLGGEVTSQGNGTVTERGVVYVAGTGTPTTSNTKVAIGSGLGTFSQTVTGLVPNSQYTVRAYAINGAGTTYGASSNTFVTGNTPPTAVDDSYIVAEDSGPTNFNVLINDVDPDAGTTLRVAGVTQPANGIVTFTASGVSFMPVANFTGVTNFTYTLADGNGGTDTGTVTVTVAGVNDAPFLTVPGAQSTAQNAPLTFGSANNNALSVGDIDAGSNPVEVTIGVVYGTATLSSTANLTFSQGDGTADAGMTFRGRVVDINFALNGLVFRPNPGFSGAASVQLTINDLGNTGSGGALSDSETIAITVVPPVNQAPVVTVPATQSTLQNTAKVFSTANGNALSVADADAGSAPLSIYISVGFGTATLSTTAGLTLSGTNGSGGFGFTGTLAAINNALNGLSFAPNSGFSGAASLQLSADDQGNTGSGGAKSDSKTVTINVTVPVNQAPVVTVPATQSTPQNTAKVFSSANGNALSVADADAGSGQLEIYLGAVNGAITLGSVTGISFNSGSSNGSGSMTIRGTLTAINNALNGLSFAPNSGFIGAASLQLSANDLGNTGSGGAKSDSKALTINVVDTQRPSAVVTSTAGSSGSSTSTSPIPFTITFSEGVTGFGTSDVTVMGGTFTANAVNTSVYNVVVTPTGPGSVVTVSVLANAANDAAGNGNTASNTYSLTYTPAPAITSLSPSSGPVGTSVVIAGSSFTGATGVTFNGTAAASFVVNSASSITAVVAAGTSTGAVVVTTPAGTSNTNATFTVTAANTSTALTSSANPSAFGQNVTFTATVTNTSGSATPAGTVTFKDGSTTITTGPLNAAGVSSFSTSGTTVGSHSMTVVYNPATGFNASTSAVLNQVVNPAATTVALTSSVNPSTLGQSVTFTATVATTAPGTGTPSPGTVTFKDGTTNLGTASTNGIGVATYATSALTVGSHSITAVYSANTNYAASTSAALTQVVNPAAPVVTSVAGPANGTYRVGQLLNFLVSFDQPVTVSTAGGTPVIILTIGSTPRGVTYFSGSNTNTLTFRYLVQAGDLDTDGVTLGNSIAANNGTLRNATGTNAVLTLNNVSALTGVLVDGVVPTATVSTTAANPSSTSLLPITITFSEPVTGLTAAGITVTNGTKGTLSGSGTTYTLNVTATASGPVTVLVSASVAQDAAGNPNPQSNTLSVTYTPPPVAISSFTPTSGSAGTVVTITGTGFSGATSVTINNGAVASYTVDSNTQITATVAATNTTGLIRVVSPAGSGASSTNFVVGPAVTAVTATANGTYKAGHTLRFFVAFSQAVTVTGTPSLGLTVGSAARTLAYDSGSGTNTLTFSYVIVAGDLDTDGVQLSSGAIALNGGTIRNSGAADADLDLDNVAPTTGLLVDAVAPTVTVSSPTNTAPIPVTVTFSEVVTGLSAGGITVGNGSVTGGSLSGSGTTYTFTVTPTAAGVVTVSVAANAAQDAATNGNVASTQFSITYAPAPAIALLTPNSGPVGTSVVVTGSNLAGATSVSFNGTSQATITANSASSLTVAVPAGASTGLLTVTTPNGTSNGLTFTVTAASTSTTLASSVNPSALSQAVTFTATVANTNGSALPTGTVTFMDGSTMLGAGPLDASGQATYTTSALSAGSHPITASYGSTADFAASTSAVLTQVVNVTGAATATVSLVVAPNPAIFGDLVSLTATVSGSGSTPTGTVTFRDGSTTLGTGTLSGGQASISISTLNVGSHPLTAQYSGDVSYGTGTGSQTLVVNPAATSTTLASSLNPSAVGQAVTFTATISQTSNGSPVATGTVTFKDGATTLGTGAISGGVATYTSSALAQGSHAITAEYAAGGNYAASTSAALTQVVNAAPATGPTVTSLSAGAELPGMPVVITGTGFSSGSTVSFGGTPAAGVTFTSATSLTAIVPAGAAAGSSVVTVTTGGQTSGSAPAFAVLQVYDAAANCLSTVPYATTGDGAWHYLLAPNGQVVAALQDTRAALGSVGLDFLVTGPVGAVRQDGRGRKYLDRNWHLTASNPTFAGPSVNVRFYGLVSEFDRLQAADATVSYATLKATQYSGPNEDCVLSNNSAGGEARTLPVAAGTPGNGVAWFVAEASVPDHFSEFYLTGSSAPLPVELSAFTAEAKGSAVQLAWTTASEKNSARFEIERSTDGVAFAKIGQLAAAGSSTMAHAYAFVDATPGTGQLYYRLRQIDLDGTAAYSPVRVVALTGPSIAVFPNPTTTGRATLTGAAPGTSVQVFDVTGRLVLTADANAAGQAGLLLPAGTPSGVYLVRAGRHTLRLMVE